MRSLLVSLLVLAGCANDNFTYTSANVILEGDVEIGDKIGTAVVFVDYNDDNTLSFDEPRGSTDATGHFRFQVDANVDELTPHSLVAVITTDSVNAGTGDKVTTAVHLRSHVTGATGNVINPFTTAIFVEDQLGKADAKATFTAALVASNAQVSSQIDLTADYTAADSHDNAVLRVTATTMAMAIGATVNELNSEQSLVDVNDRDYFDPIVDSLAAQLTNIANGTFMYAQFSTTEQMNVFDNPGSYIDLFLDADMYKATLTAELSDSGGDYAAMLAEKFGEAVFEQFMEECIRLITGEVFSIVGELIGELIIEA